MLQQDNIPYLPVLEQHPRHKISSVEGILHAWENGGEFAYIGDEGGVSELLRRSELVDRPGRLFRLHDEAGVETVAAAA